MARGGIRLCTKTVKPGGWIVTPQGVAFPRSASYSISTLRTGMDPPAQRPNTRAKNANQHPGRVNKRRRRTKAEIEHDRAILQAKKETSQQEKKDIIERVIELEDKMAVDEANVGSAHPWNCGGILLFFASHR